MSAPTVPSAATPMATDGDGDDDVIVGIISEFSQVFAFARNRWAKYAEEIHPDLRSPGMVILQTVIRRGAVTATELSHLLDMDKALISRQVAKLRELEFIHTAPSPEDGRVMLLTPTESARTTVANMQSRTAHAYRERFEDWNDSDLVQLHDLLQQFNQDERVARESALTRRPCNEQTSESTE